MEELIKQAFLHVDMLGQHVAEGHYDLIGPNGEIILPQVWETMIEPDWSVTMHMWPMPEPKSPMSPPGHPGHHHAQVPGRPPSRGQRRTPGPPPMAHRGGAGHPMVPPPPPAGARPPGMGAHGPGGPPIIVMPQQGAGPSRPKTRKPEPKSGILGWIGGSSKPKSCESHSCVYLHFHFLTSSQREKAQKKLSNPFVSSCSLTLSPPRHLSISTY